MIKVLYVSVLLIIYEWAVDGSSNLEIQSIARSALRRRRIAARALRQLCCFGQIFFVLIRNLPANVTRILSLFDSSGVRERDVVIPHNMCMVTTRRADATALT